VVVCIAVYALAVAAVVFTPVSYSRVVNGVASWMRTDLGLTPFGSGWIEFAGNIALFLPLGFLLTLLFRHAWYGALLALVVSIGVEVVQMVIPDRQASVRDVISNSIGAAIGAFLAWLFVLRSAHRRARAAAAESAD
jgi:glycopeptide antibiotics resistance protein